MVGPLGDSRDLLERIAAHVPGMIYQFRLDPDGTASFPYASAGIAEIYEATPEDVRDDLSALMSRVHPEDSDAVWAAIRESAETMQPWKQEYRVVLPTRGERWLRGESSPERLPDGAILWHGYITDITEQRRAQEQLAESEERLALVLEVSNEGVWDWSAETDTVAHNRRWCEMLGLDEGYLEHPIEDFVALIHEEDREEVLAKIGAAQSTSGLRPAEPGFEIEYRLVRRDGAVIWVQDKGHVVSRGPDGRVTRMLGRIADITAAREAEAARARALDVVDSFFELSLDLLLITRLDGEIVRVNPTWTDVLGHTADELVGTRFHPLIHPEDLHGASAFAELVRTDEPLHDIILRIRAADGSWRWLEWRARRYAEFIFAAARDITDAREREAALEEAKEAALAASRAKSAFLATMSHEIRTPMNGVVGATELLRQGDLDLEQEQLVRTIESSAAVLLSVINDVLDFSRIESGRLDMERAPVDFRAVVQDAILSVRPAGTAVATEVDIDPDIPPFFEGDPLRLRQVLNNLLNNAFKFTHEGVVRVRAARRADRLVVVVEDTGIGIDYQQLKSLFEPFVQADSTTARQYGGTGLGLTITQRLIELMGGEISVESTPEEGAAFLFELPLMPCAGPGGADGSTGDVEEGLRVLVAEDNSINQQIVRRMLIALDAQVCLVEDGQAAVEHVERGGWDLVLMDVQMPGMDGFEATRRIRAFEAGRGEHIPIIALTANAMEDDRQRCLDAGMDDYLSKPVRRRQLAQLLGRWSKRARGAA